MHRLMTFRTGVHYSSQNQRNADPDPHVTVRVATSEMRQQGKSLVLHARVKSQVDPIYIGSTTYPEQTLDGDMQRKSYLNPDYKAKYNEVRSSLFKGDDLESTSVGCVVSHGQAKWYVVDSSGELEFLPEGTDGKFFSAGVGKDEHLRFWDPLKNKTCRAVFFGVERPATTSPQYSILDTNSSDLVEAFSEFELQDKGKKAEMSWETSSMSSTVPMGYSTSVDDSAWGYYHLSSQPIAGSSPSASGGYTTQYSKAADTSDDIEGEVESSHPATLQSNVCFYVRIMSRSEKKYRGCLIGGEEIQLRTDGWVSSTIDYGGNTVPCWAYTGKSGSVYYTWNFDIKNKGRKQ